MKGFLSFVIAVLLYLVLGLIAWNIVCSIIDIPSKTIEQLADYRLFTYSGVTLAVTFLIPIFDGSSISEDSYFPIFIILGINLGVAIAINHWENVWPSVSVIFTIIYNLFNIIWMTLLIRALFPEKNNK